MLLVHTEGQRYSLIYCLLVWTAGLLTFVRNRMTRGKVGVKNALYPTFKDRVADTLMLRFSARRVLGRDVISSIKRQDQVRHGNRRGLLEST